MSGPPDIGIAEAKVKQARARLLSTLGQVQERLSPSNLAQDAVESAAQSVASMARKGRDAVRSRPFAAAAVTGAIGLVMARGWIGDILGSRRHGHETADSPKGLKHRRKSAKGHSKMSNGNPNAETDGKSIGDNPALLLAGGVAIGVAIGMLLPRLERERQALAPVGRKLADRASATVSAVKEAGREEVNAFIPGRDAAKERVSALFGNIVEAAKGATTKA